LTCENRDNMADLTGQDQWMAVMAALRRHAPTRRVLCPTAAIS